MDRDQDRRTHPADELPGLLFGELGPAEAARVGDHLAGCDACRVELAEMATASAALRNVARREASPVPETPARWRPPRWAVPVAAALVAAVVTAGGLLATRDEPGRTVPLAAVGGATAAGTARVVDDGRVVSVKATGLAAGPGQFYEVWLLDQGSGRLLPLGLLDPDGHGRFTLPRGVAGAYPTLDVSVEADDGDPGHSGRSVLRGNRG
jgi:hypothetical protein